MCEICENCLYGFKDDEPKTAYKRQYSFSKVLCDDCDEYIQKELRRLES